MTTISADIIADSISPSGVRLVTYSLVYPRFFHQELLTARAFCRNSASSRAIPAKRAMRAVEEHPAMPLHWGVNQAGMQADTKLVVEIELRAARALWRQALRSCTRAARHLVDGFDLHKQIVNRIIEPWAHMSTIVTATDYDNFFALRCHPMAEPHFRALAWKMADLYYGSNPTELSMGEWHLPYVSDSERDKFSIEDLKKFSTARCARVSYNNHDGTNPSPEKDLKLHDRLMAGLLGDDELEPGHLSPLEHQATPFEDPTHRSGPLRGWRQYRKEFARENMTFDYEAAKARGWRGLAYEIFEQDDGSSDYPD